MKQNRNTVLIILSLIIILSNALFSASQRKKYADEIIKSNIEVKNSNIEIKKSNDSLITAIKELYK